MKELLILIVLIHLQMPYDVLSKVTHTEICDNARDDDGDGWIDLNDAECNCPPLSPPSLFPNPSFEEQDCCPGNNSQLSCARGWIQASFPTTDYLHPCGWMGWDEFPLPVPIPDGEGLIGFRNGDVNVNGNGPRPNWKEYAGAILNEPLEIGKYYRIEFYLGFSNVIYSPPIQVAFYGAPSSHNLPFGIDDADFGCPTNGPGWLELGKVGVSGVNSWEKAMIEFSPSQKIEAIAIGPDCEQKPLTNSSYYFFDHLILAEKEAFDFGITQTGNPCTGNASLEVPRTDAFRYQWYKDGIALPGETRPVLDKLPSEGAYRVRLSGADGCRLTDAYYFQIPTEHSVREVSICAGDRYTFNGRMLSEAGVYRDTLRSASGCDSIAELRLSVLTQAVDTVRASIFGNESWQVGNRSFAAPGHYTIPLTTTANCDSLIYLILEQYRIYIPNAFSPNQDGVNDFFAIHPGPKVREISQLYIFDRWGEQVVAARGIDWSEAWDGRSGGKLVAPGVYLYRVEVVFDDNRPRTLVGTLTVIY